jgi:hypothetical protein
VRSIAGGIVVFLSGSALFFAGCSGSGVAGTVPVSGKVTYKGQPVGGATVSFIGEAGGSRGAVAVSEADGTYKLRTLETEGALPGKYTVTVTKTESAASTTLPTMEEMAKSSGKPPPEAKELLPAKYGDPAQTPLKFEVKAGSNNIDLPLTD